MLNMTRESTGSKRKALDLVAVRASKAFRSHAEGHDKKRIKQEHDEDSSLTACPPSTGDNHVRPKSAADTEMPPDQVESDSPLRSHGTAKRVLKHDRIPPGILAVFCRSKSEDEPELYQTAVDTMLRKAFGSKFSETTSSAPGLDYVQRVIEAVRDDKDGSSESSEIEETLMRLWRCRLAGYLGRTISNSRELREVKDVIASAMSIPPGSHKRSVRPTNNVEDISKAELVPSSEIRLKSDCDTEQTTRKISILGASTLQTPQRLVAGMSLEKPALFETFFQCVQQISIYFKSCRAASERLERAGADDFRVSAARVFNSLDRPYLEEWESVHKSLRCCSTQAMEGARQLLTQQDIVAKLVRPIFVPYVHPAWNSEHRNKVVFIVNTPDVPTANVSPAELHAACVSSTKRLRAVTGPVQAWNDHMWVAEFGDKFDAANAEGNKVEVNGITLEAEHLYPHVPAMFVCDLAGVNVTKDEVARSVARSFNGLLRNEKPKLHCCEDDLNKLYPGPQYAISIPKVQRFYRFYLPLRMKDSVDVFIACFRPLNLTARCHYCRNDRCSHPCERAKEIMLPSTR